MDRWFSVLKIPLNANTKNHYRVAASLNLSSSSVSANVIFFHGDRVKDTGNHVIESFYDLQKVSEIIVSKFGNFVNAFVIEASIYNGPFAIYKDFVPSVNHYGEPQSSYSSIGFPASSSIVSLLSRSLEEVCIGEKVCLMNRRTIVLGFSKGGVVINQLLSEISSLEGTSSSLQEHYEKIQIFLKSICEVHYIDVGLNCAGAYITDRNVVQRISKRFAQGGGGNAVRIFLHGTPRQWCDEKRGWIVEEKDELVRLIESEAENSGGKLRVCERFYFADRVPDLQMHFEIIDAMDVS